MTNLDSSSQDFMPVEELVSVPKSELLSYARDEQLVVAMLDLQLANLIALMSDATFALRNGAFGPSTLKQMQSRLQPKVERLQMEANSIQLTLHALIAPSSSSTLESDASSTENDMPDIQVMTLSDYLTTLESK